MIGSVRGTLTLKQPETVLVDVGGVGYQMNVSFHTLSSLPAEGKEVFFYVHTHVREDVIQLYGFSTEEEKRIFITLIGITGIGPKMALTILSGITHNDLLHAIDTEDVAMLCRIPGLGKKTAHRLILELREKLPARREKTERAFDDTLSALVNLGYKKSAAREYLERAYQKGYRDIESLLRETLKYLQEK